MKKIGYSFESWIKSSQDDTNLYPTEIASILKIIYKKDKELFFQHLKDIDNKFIGKIILELSDKLKTASIKYLSFQALAEATKNLESDDATDLIQIIRNINREKFSQVLILLPAEKTEEIYKLLNYSQNQAGAWMQTEFFYAFIEETVSDSITRLKKLKKIGKLDEVYQLFIVDKDFTILGSMRTDNLLILDSSKKFSDLTKKLDYKNISVYANDDIKIVSNKFEEYNLQVLPVVDKDDKIIGRITSDDAYDMISEIATEHIYNMAGVDDEVEEDENIKNIIKTRASWLFVNLFTAVLASIVIGIFDTTLQALIPLAILMPIVASMGGNAGTQTLTVVVRKIALGEIDKDDGKNIIKREVLVSLVNGFIFAISISVITFFWFDNIMLGVVIAIAMIVNLVIAGFFGSVVPLTLKNMNIDPAIGSTVLLTTATDIFGFFIFLGLAELILL